MILYQLDRFNPDPGQLGGHVADVVVLTNETCILEWLTEPYGIEIYPSEQAMRKVRERSGRNRLVRVSLS